MRPMPAPRSATSAGGRSTLRLVAAFASLGMACSSGSSPRAPLVDGGEDAPVDAGALMDATSPTGPDADGAAMTTTDGAEPPPREDGAVHAVCPPEDEQVPQVCCRVSAPGTPGCTPLDGGCYSLIPCDPCPSEAGDAPPACGATGAPCADQSGSGVVVACGVRCVGTGGICP
jgi:hypothetical protein